MIKDFNSNKNEQADYIVHVGWYSLCWNRKKELEVQTIWDLFMNQIVSIASQIPYLTATRNHEKEIFILV
jgi:hypothetical protein